MVLERLYGDLTLHTVFRCRVLSTLFWPTISGDVKVPILPACEMRYRTKPGIDRQRQKVTSATTGRSCGAKGTTRIQHCAPGLPGASKEKSSKNGTSARDDSGYDHSHLPATARRTITDCLGRATPIQTRDFGIPLFPAVSTSPQCAARCSFACAGVCSSPRSRSTSQLCNLPPLASSSLARDSSDDSALICFDAVSAAA